MQRIREAFVPRLAPWERRHCSYFDELQGMREQAAKAVKGGKGAAKE